MKTKVLPILFSLLVVGFASQSLILNTWDILHLRLPDYYVNPSFLMGTLLLYDRPMFFETRRLEVKEKNAPNIETLEYDMQTPGYNTYLERRLYRFATNETNCGGDSAVAFQELFCRPKLQILKDKKIEEVTVRFTSHVRAEREKVFHHECGRDD